MSQKTGVEIGVAVTVAAFILGASVTAAVKLTNLENTVVRFDDKLEMKSDQIVREVDALKRQMGDRLDRIEADMAERTKDRITLTQVKHFFQLMELENEGFKAPEIDG